MPKAFISAIVRAMLTNLNFSVEMKYKKKNQANWRQEIKPLQFIFTECFDFLPSWHETELAHFSEMFLTQ